MKNISFLIADKAYINTKTKKVNIEGLITTIHTERFPSLHESISTVLLFESEKNKLKYELLLDYEGREIVIAKKEIIKKEKENGHTVISVLNRIPLVSSTNYVFKAKINNKIVAERVLKIKLN